jgi:Arc/MetJ family transcription regulator
MVPPSLRAPGPTTINCKIEQIAVGRLNEFHVLIKQERHITDRRASNREILICDEQTHVSRLSVPNACKGNTSTITLRGPHISPGVEAGFGGALAASHQNEAPKRTRTNKQARMDVSIKRCYNSCLKLAEVPMRTTIALDDDLIAKAQAYTGLEEKAALVREALKALIQREAAKRLANLGGSQPGIKGAPRRRQDVE